MTAKKHVLTLRIGRDLDDKIRDLSGAVGVSKNAYILMILSKEVQKAG